MPKLWLALTPSNQAYNKWGNTDELRQMAAFADAMATVANRYDAITCKVFNGQAETNTASNPNLRAQLDAAYSWLNTANAGTLTVGLGLHSDSGTTPHVGAYWGNADITKRLALALREQMRIFFGSATGLAGANYEEPGYLQWTRAYGKHCPVILELGSHQVPAMVDRLASNPTYLANLLVDALLAFFVLPKTLKPVPVDATDDALNGMWYYLTLAEGAPNVDVARVNATLAKSKIVALKAAIGR